MNIFSLKNSFLLAINFVVVLFINTEKYSLLLEKSEKLIFL